MAPLPGWRIQADDGVKVRDGAALHLGDLHVVDANTLGGFTHGAQVAVEESTQRYGEAPPQLGGVTIELSPRLPDDERPSDYANLAAEQVDLENVVTSCFCG